MIKFSTTFVVKFWSASFLVVYSLLAATIFSASFGSAVAVSLYAFLFLLSMPILWKYGSEFSLMTYERCSLILVLWLILSSCFRPNFAEGISFILSEYRTLLMAPFMAFAVARLLSVRQVWAPVVIGSLFNMIGSWLLVAAKYSAASRMQDVQQILGLVAGGKGSRFALDGKFIQACLMAFWSGTSFYWCRLKPLSKALFQAVCVYLVLMLMLYHGLIFADARSGAFVATATLTTLVFLVISSEASGWARNGLYGLATIVGIVTIYGLLDNLSLATAIENINRFLLHGVNNTSIGLRLLTYKQLGVLDWDQFVFGVGGDNWKEVIRLMFPAGTSGYRFVIWNDFHSQIVWLLIKGGLVSLILYLAMIGYVANRSCSLIRFHKAYAAGGLGISVCVILLLMGSMNSLFTAMRESHFVAFLLVILGALDRLQSADCNRLVGKFES